MIENVYLGIQGWNHPEWIGRIYANGIPSGRWLGEYAQRFSTVEVDDTFYGVPPEPLLKRWRDTVPAEFTFSLKVPHQITHEQRFALNGGLLNKFLDRVSLLDDNLGVLLLVAPVGFEPDDATSATLREFLERLPAGYRWALELKHVGWFDEGVHELAARRNVAIVTGESRWIRRKSMLKLTHRPTADFAYVRWSKPHKAGRSAESNAANEAPGSEWRDALARLSGLVGSVYGYFQVGAFGDGLRNAEEFQRLVRDLKPEVPVSEDSDSP